MLAYQKSSKDDYVAVVGAGGHVGLPFSLSIAASHRKVIGIDKNQEVVDKLNMGIVPYIENDAEVILGVKLHNQVIEFTTDPTAVRKASMICIMIGTPIDENGNPSVDDIFNYFEYLYSIDAIKGNTFVLRSTVIPGTTRAISNKLKMYGLIHGIDYFLFFAPERVSQGHGLAEFKELPQIIGYNWNPDGLSRKEIMSVDYSRQLQEDIITKVSGLFPKHASTDSSGWGINYVSWEEAELAKLITNMYRYVNFALANEFYMICREHGVDATKIINLANYEYPRMNMDKPGFAAGPCLYKDGHFLLSKVPYSELIRGSFTINENIVDYLWNELQVYPRPAKVLILGAAFKPESDDTRNSLSFRMAKVLKRNGITYDIYDPYVEKYSKLPNFGDYDMIIVMTPHKVFLDKKSLWKRFFKKGVILVDITSKFTPNSLNGIEVL